MFNTLTRMGASGAGDYEIERSLRFNEADSESCTRTPGSAGNRKTWTFSAWVKFSDNDNHAPIFSAGTDANNYFKINRANDNHLYVVVTDGGTYYENFKSTAYIRDFSAWYHIVVAWDSTQSTYNDRVKVYINGVDIPGTRTSGPGLNYDNFVNNTVLHDIGRATYNAGEWLNGYMTEIHHIDGTRLDATAFGKTNAVTGQWVPKKYAGSYGTNGFYLDFANNDLLTNFVDSSSSARTITRVGNVTHSSTQKKIGATSIYFDGTDDCLHVPDHSDFSFGTGDFTLETWFRRSRVDADEWILMHSDGTSADSAAGIQIWSAAYGGSNANKAHFRLRMGGSNISVNGTTTLAINTWYHMAGVRDGNTARLYINGVQEGSVSISGSLNDSSAPFVLGAVMSNGNAGIQGYLDNARVSNNCRYPDGTSFTPSTSHYTSDGNTLWLVTSDVSKHLGTDASGNDNDFTPSNFSVTAGKTNDSLTDSPTNNYCTLNPDNTGQGIDPSAGNLKFDWNTNGNLHEIACGTFGFKSGSWYWEMQLESGYMSDSVGVGIIRDDQDVNNSGNGPVASPTSFEAYGYRNDGKKLTKAGGAENYGATWTSTSDVIGVHVDFTGGTGSITFYKNNSSQGAISSIPLNNHWLPWIGGYGSSSGNQSKMYINFGQRDFAYTPPTGAKALCSTNLSEPTILDGTEHFNTVLYTGNGGSQSITGVGFQPDLLWIKNRDQADNHQLHDVIRGTTKGLHSNTSGAEYTDTDALDSFDSDGFSMDNNYDSHNKSSENYVAWNWKGGGSGSSNTTGDIDSTVSANPTAGFSIVSYQGNQTAGQSVGHGMGVAPEIIFFKNRSSSSRNWEINAVNPNDQTYDYFYLNLTAAVGGGSLGISNPTSSVFEVTAGNDANQNGHDFMAYCFSSVEGYSKFGTYIGNGNGDGPFIYTGFKPAFVMLKTLTFDKGWRMTDSVRDPTNPIHASLFPNLANEEYTATGSNQQGQQFLSNGFKIQNTNSRDNQDGERYMYLAFAESPFKYSHAK